MGKIPSSLAGSSVDVTIHIKGMGKSQPEATIDRSLVEFLCHVRKTGSVQDACDAMHFSARKVQRMLKRFEEASGIELLSYHGWQGTELTAAGNRCIALYGEALQSVRQIVREHGGTLQGSVNLDMYAVSAGGTLKLAAQPFQGRSRDPTNQKMEAD